MPEIILTSADRDAHRSLLAGHKRPEGSRRGMWWRLTQVDEKAAVHEGLDILRSCELRALVRDIPVTRQALDLPD
jgi:hypothetical protein